ncbi:MAG: cytochrome c [Gammaproteobacteria bacterium]|nr:cytochrome c [Gammaproteobacteria bacterium]
MHLQDKAQNFVNYDFTETIHIDRLWNFDLNGNAWEGSGESGGNTENGALLYSNNCAGCHGTGSSSSKKNRSKSAIQSAIQNNSGGMGALSSLPDAELDDLEAYLATL